MLQMRVFYAMTDARTPTLIQVGMVGVKIPLLLACPLLLPPEQVVLGLAAANGVSFVGGAVLGQWLLRRRLGRARSGEVLVCLAKVASASAVAAAVAIFTPAAACGHLLVELEVAVLQRLNLLFHPVTLCGVH